MEKQEPSQIYDVQAERTYLTQETLVPKRISTSEIYIPPSTPDLYSSLIDPWEHPITALQHSSQHQEWIQSTDPPFAEDFGCALVEDDPFVGPDVLSSAFSQQKLGQWETQNPRESPFNFGYDRVAGVEPDFPINNLRQSQLPPDISYLDSKNHQEYLCQLVEVETESRRIDLQRDRSKGEVERLKFQIEMEELNLIRSRVEDKRTQAQDKN